MSILTSLKGGRRKRVERDEAVWRVGVERRRIFRVV